MHVASLLTRDIVRRSRLALAGVGLLAPCIGSAVGVTEYHVSYPYPIGLVSGRDGNLWFTEVSGFVVGNITRSGQVSEYVVSYGGLGVFADIPAGIALGADGNLWFGDDVNHAIGRITPSGTIVEFPLADQTHAASGVAAGPDGNVWFTESTAKNVGRISQTGTVREFHVPGSPNAITLGPDGNLWFTESKLSGCGIDFCTTAQGWAAVMTPAGVLQAEYPLPGTNVMPAGITTGPDGNLWVTEVVLTGPEFQTGGGSIARVGIDGAVATFPLPTANALPAGIAAGPDGALWFTESRANKIGRITTSGAVTEYAIPTFDSVPVGIAKGPDGNIWFTEKKAQQIGRLALDPVPPPPIGGYISGNWYIPNQAGHGFQIEVTTSGQMIAIWFVYTPDGSGQAWIYAQGAYDPSKSSVTLTAELLTGAKFPPNFNPADVHPQDGTQWGTLSFAFTDCNHGTVRWHSDLPGYNLANEQLMPITRLTQIAGTSCPSPAAP